MLLSVGPAYANYSCPENLKSEISQWKATRQKGQWRFVQRPIPSNWKKLITHYQGPGASYTTVDFELIKKKFGMPSTKIRGPYMLSFNSTDDFEYCIEDSRAEGIYNEKQGQMWPGFAKGGGKFTCMDKNGSPDKAKHVVGSIGEGDGGMELLTRDNPPVAVPTIWQKSHTYASCEAFNAETNEVFIRFYDFSYFDVGDTGNYIVTLTNDYDAYKIFGEDDF